MYQWYVQPVPTAAFLLLNADRGRADRRARAGDQPLMLKLGDLAGPLGDGIRGQILPGSVLSGVGDFTGGQRYGVESA